MQYDVLKTSDTTTIGLKGRMCFSDHALFREIIEAFDQPAGDHMILDMGGLEFLDSSGLGMLLIARDEAKKRQLELVIQKVPASVRRVMDMARFDRHFTIRA